MKWIFTTITVWLLFVLSLSTWWMIFGLKTLDQLAQGHVGEGSQILRQQKMLFYEGSFLAIMQILGGLGLFYFAFRMYQEKAATEKFFASFAHDIKTSLFRLQLFVEGIEGDENQSLRAGLLAKSRHLQLNLENGLNSVLGGRNRLFIESIQVSDFVTDIHLHWPELQIELQGDQKVSADRKALRSVFENLLHNSFFHGRAEKVIVAVKKIGETIVLSYRDSGRPFQGKIEGLGAQPVASEKGSGFGLYLVQFWVSKMQGKVQFHAEPKGGLEIEISLPEGR